MDTALVERLLLLIGDVYKRNFEQERLKMPNRNFCDTFQFFLEQYGVSTEAERQNNKDNMRAEWTIADGFEALVARIDDAIHYGELAGHKIPNAEAVDAGLTAFLKTGQLGAACEEWLEQADDQKTWAHFKS